VGEKTRTDIRRAVGETKRLGTNEKKPREERLLDRERGGNYGEESGRKKRNKGMKKGSYG